MSFERGHPPATAALAATPRSVVGHGTQRVFTGASLAQVAFPLGGIGTGTVALGGRGDLRDWEVFNRPATGKRLPFTFFSLWAKPDGQPANAWVLERQILPPYTASHGLPPGQVAGLPRLAEARFTGAYPFAEIELADPSLPLDVSLEAFNPFVPLDAEASSLPVAHFRWRLHNPGSVAVNATLAFSLLNAVGYDGQADLGNRRWSGFGGNLNEWVDEPGLAGLRLTNPSLAADDPAAGELIAATTWPDTTHLLHWERGVWFDDIQSYWDTFRAAGRFADDSAPSPSPAGESDVGTLGLVATIQPGQTVELPVVLAWRFPNLVNYWNQEEPVRGKRLGNYYATRHASAWDAARYLVTNLDDLETKTRAYHDALFGSSLPASVLDAVSSQASIIRTTTCLRTEDGAFHAFEGCNDNSGCCPMDCTHVWNYEQSLAYLFPALERTMRLTDYGLNTLPDGEQRFRTLLPVSSGALWNFLPAADGQMGGVVKLYREWLLSGDEVFLRRVWPQAQRSLAYAWRYWDADRDGVMEGEQHNTYDIEFYGPNTYMGSLYLSALRAAEEMARALGQSDAADEYHRVYELGRSKLDEQTWAGKYYIQRTHNPEPGESLRDRYSPDVMPTGGIREGETEPRYQYGAGCLSDQLLGQWLAHVVGLGHVLPENHVKDAARSIFGHNWKASLAGHHNAQRTYGLNGEAGLLICSWPDGGRPRYPFPYADEIWTGTEYAVAGLLIYEGLVDEGLAVVRGTRDRHDGVARNPWDEFECGHHYARAMASWSLLLALSGYHCDAAAGRLSFAPVYQPTDFRSFFSTGTGWGSYSQRLASGVAEYGIEVAFGEVELRELVVSVLGATSADRVAVTGPAGELEAAPSVAGERLTVQLPDPVRIRAGERLVVKVG